MHQTNQKAVRGPPIHGSTFWLKNFPWSYIVSYSGVWNHLAMDLSFLAHSDHNKHNCTLRHRINYLIYVFIIDVPAYFTYSRFTVQIHPKCEINTHFHVNYGKGGDVKKHVALPIVICLWKSCHLKGHSSCSKGLSQDVFMLLQVHFANSHCRCW